MNELCRLKRFVQICATSDAFCATFVDVRATSEAFCATFPLFSATRVNLHFLFPFQKRFAPPITIE